MLAVHPLVLCHCFDDKRKTQGCSAEDALGPHQCHLRDKMGGALRSHDALPQAVGMSHLCDVIS